MTCETARKQLSLYLYGELSFDEEDLIEQHLDGCAACAGELERERAVHRALDRAEAEAPEGLLEECRSMLHTRLEQVRPAGAKPPFWRRLGAYRRGLPAFAPMGFLKPAGALALVAVGFFAARFTAPSARVEMTAANPAGPVASRVRYVQPDQAGNVRIVLEDTSQRVLTGRLEDEPIRRMLLAAASDPANPGLRVESVDILKNRPDTPEVRQALLGALQHDNNAGVRLKALEGLKPYSADPEIRAALARVLLADDNPGVRIQAIDILTQTREAALAGVLQDLLRTEDNDYVRQRCQRALRDMNASVETF